MIANYFIFTVLCVITIRINCQCFPRDAGKELHPHGEEILRRAQFLFALESLKKIQLVHPTGNVLFSPHNLHRLLIDILLGAYGKTEVLLRKLLHVPNEIMMTDILYSYPQQKLSTNYHNSQYNFYNIERIYINKAKSITGCMDFLCNDEPGELDFNRECNTTLEINNYISENTQEQMKNFISVGTIPQDTDIVFATAVYFKGPLMKLSFSWNLEDNKDLFSIFSNNLIKPDRRAKYEEHPHECNCNILEIPYETGNISLFVFLPIIKPFQNYYDNNGIKTLIDKITNIENVSWIQTILNNGLSEKEEIISIPDFTIEKELSVDQLLEKMNAADVLNSTANLVGIFDNPEGLRPLKIIHKAKIVVENLTNRFIPWFFYMHSKRFDRPFVYIVYDKENKSILFNGIYRIPEGTG